MNDLTIQETTEYERCKSVMKDESGAAARFHVAAMQIREQKLYRAQYGTFEEFCTVELGLTRRRFDQMQEAQRVFANFAEPDENGKNFSQTESGDDAPGDPVAPANEAQARELAGLPPEEQRAAFAEAVAEAPVKKGKRKVTAKGVQRVVARRKKPADTAASPADTDPAGSPLPDRPDLRAVFDTLPAFAKVFSLHNQLIAALKAVWDSPAAVRIPVPDQQTVENHYRAARKTVFERQPAAICDECKGLKDKCARCDGLGWLMKQTVDRLGVK